jgi:uncharacterized protein YecE (DUF72 family)
MVDGWRRRTPPGFRLAAKLPQSITHEKRLVDVEAELFSFLEAISRLEDRLGPLLAQLPPDFRRGPEEWAALQKLVALLPPGPEYAVEFRHRSWAQPETFDLLRQRGIAWCINDLHYLPATVELTSDFTYLRWLGDHRKIEQFGAVVIDRDAETDRWAETLAELSSKITRVYGYYNNHYAGHSPASVRALQRRLGLEESPPLVRGLFDL